MMEPLTVETLIAASLDTVWDFWTNPDHITQWNHASDDWHCPSATNEIREGGEFQYVMAAKDNSVSFVFRGTYLHVVKNESIVYFIEDGRKVIVLFTQEEGGVRVTELFEPEEVNSMEQQLAGWQAILDNFRKYTEGTPD